MQTKIPKKFLRSKYRKEMWKNAKKIIHKREKILPVSEVYLRGILGIEGSQKP